MNGRWTTRASALLVTLLLVSIIMTIPAQAAPGCSAEIGKRVPVLLVHGFNSNESVWGDEQDGGSFIGSIGYMEGVDVKAFDYEPYSLQWVTNPQIGEKLAEQIICLSEASKKGGGSGEVVVVAHSMGGLATRQAIAENLAVAKALGLVITIATPHNGSFFDRQALALAEAVCRLNPGANCNSMLDMGKSFLTAFPGLSEGSAQVLALPEWPADVPVYAIAGNIALHYNLFGLEWDAAHSGNDALVTTNSALYDRTVGQLGGHQQVRCTGGPPPLVVGWTKAPCEHSALIQSDEVRKLVVEQIGIYLRVTTQPARKLPESCSGIATYQGSGYTLKASASVTKGAVTCDEALKVAQAYLEESGPEPTTTVGEWICQVTSTDSRGFIAECSGPAGNIRLNGE